MSSPTSSPILEVLLTGATGYIGGSVLHLLLERKDSRPLHITTLVRSKDAATKLTSATQDNGHHRLTPLVGSVDDFDLVANAADKADVVFHFADSADNLPAIDAITAGLARRRTASDGGRRQRGILIHTSGTGELITRDNGEYGHQEALSDLDMAAIHSIPLTQPHRDVDALIFDRVGAGADPAFDSYIVTPPTIYGRGLGLFNRSSIQVPILIRAFVASGKASTIGKGLNVWDHVHIEDLARLYILLLDKALEGKAGKGREGGWYFAEEGHYVLKDVATRVAEVLHARGLIPSAQVAQFKDDSEAEKALGPHWFYFGTNSKSSADRSRQLGWAPTHSTADLLASIEEEVDFVLGKRE
jgi:nucleoside-diphosphate-sugar epimerase